MMRFLPKSLGDVGDLSKCVTA